MGKNAARRRTILTGQHAIPAPTPGGSETMAAVREAAAATGEKHQQGVVTIRSGRHFVISFPTDPPPTDDELFDLLYWIPGRFREQLVHLRSHPELIVQAEEAANGPVASGKILIAPPGMRVAEPPRSS